MLFSREVRKERPADAALIPSAKDGTVRKLGKWRREKVGCRIALAINNHKKSKKCFTDQTFLRRTPCDVTLVHTYVYRRKTRASIRAWK